MYKLNKKYLVDDNNNVTTMEIDDKLKEIKTGSPLPKFGLLKTSIVNNLDIPSYSSPQVDEILSNLIFETLVFKISSLTSFVRVSQ